jgi:hypothetical protein
LNVKKFLLKLKEDGFLKIDVDYILSSFKNYIPINGLNSKILENKFNYNKILKEIKKTNPKIKTLRESDSIGFIFFSKNKSRLNESHVDIERVFKLRKEIGGQIIFCHPGKYNKFDNNMTYKLKELGLDGLEVLSPHHSIGAIMYAQYLADSLDLIATGGSDFHLFENNERINSYADWFRIDSDKLRRIKEIIN